MAINSFFPPFAIAQGSMQCTLIASLIMQHINTQPIHLLEVSLWICISWNPRGGLNEGVGCAGDGSTRSAQQLEYVACGWLKVSPERGSHTRWACFMEQMGVSPSGDWSIRQTGAWLLLLYSSVLHQSETLLSSAIKINNYVEPLTLPSCLKKTAICIHVAQLFYYLLMGTTFPTLRSILVYEFKD